VLRQKVPGENHPAKNASAKNASAKSAPSKSVSAESRQPEAQPQRVNPVRLCIVAVGQRVPDWAQIAWDDYAKRFPHEIEVEFEAVETEPATTRPWMQYLLPSARGVGCRRAAAWWRWTNAAPASPPWRWRAAHRVATGGTDVALVIGGDGWTPRFARCRTHRSSDLTLPHALPGCC